MSGRRRGVEEDRLDNRLAGHVVERLPFDLLDRACLDAVAQIAAVGTADSAVGVDEPLLTPRRIGSKAISKNTRMSSLATGS